LRTSERESERARDGERKREGEGDCEVGVGGQPLKVHKTTNSCIQICNIWREKKRGRGGLRERERKQAK